jgi:hypothetical protein
LVIYYLFLLSKTNKKKLSSEPVTLMRGSLLKLSHDLTMVFCSVLQAKFTTIGFRGPPVGLKVVKLSDFSNAPD